MGIFPVKDPAAAHVEQLLKDAPVLSDEKRNTITNLLAGDRND